MQNNNHRAFTSKIIHLFVPKDIKEALDDPYWTMVEEINALKRSGIWEVVDLLRDKDKKTVGCKYVFTVKCRAEGSIDRYKARLVAKGFT